MKKLLKQHQTRVSQKKILKLNLKILLIGFIAIIICGIISIANIKYGDFAKEVWNTQLLVSHCNDMQDFIEDYPRSTLNKKDIAECTTLGLI